VASPYYSHFIRWTNAARLQRFMAEPADVQRRLEEELVPIPKGFNQWSALSQAQYLEITTFLSSYLLAAQGDRVAMGHSVEGRFPFLDYRVVEFANRLPSDLKLRGLREKWLLRQLGKSLLPDDIWTRRKRPYRAPIQRSFFNDDPSTAYVAELLSEKSVKDAGLVNPQAVAQLAAKARGGAALSETDDMAVAGILSAQLVHQHFIANFDSHRAALNSTDRVKVIAPAL
jgi:asparagine synthase (glutamine-hydrolysing)